MRLIRSYKIQNLSDDLITEKLSANYSREEITKGLAALQYMRPTNLEAYEDTTIPPTSMESPETLKVEVVKKIINKRKKGALSGVTIVILVLTAMAIFNSSISTQALLITAIVLLPPLSAMYGLNARNYEHLRPSYRTWNTWIYNYGAKFLIITAVLDMLSNVTKLANPMHGFKDPSAPSKSSLLLDTAVDATVAVLAYSNLKPAEYIEEYFKQNKASKSYTEAL